MCLLGACGFSPRLDRKPGKGRNGSASALVSHIPPQCRHPRWHSGKESACQCRRLKRCRFPPWIGKTPELGNSNPLRYGNPLQYSCLENHMDGGACWAAVHGVAKSRLSDFTFTFHINALEMEMAIHSSVLAWRSPGMVEPGGLPSMESHRVGHD